jgi:ATP-binding cassette, subfamily D (ALD), member 4
MTIGYYTYYTYISIGWYAPAIVFGYFIISYILSKIIMGPIVHRVFRQEKLEGDLRFAHVRVRTNTEAIAIYGGENIERDHVNMRFERVLVNKLALIKWDFLLLSALLRLPCNPETFQLIFPLSYTIGVNNVFSYFGSMVNFMILAIPLLNGWPLNINSAGAVALAAFQIIMLISGFSKFNNVSQKVSDIAGYAARVGQLFDVMEQLGNYRPDSSLYDGTIVDSIIPTSAATAAAAAASEELETLSPESPFVLEFVSVSIWTPHERRLVRNLRLQLRERQSLLIMGPSGCGKSTILRTIGGLWPFFSGVIKRPGSSTARPLPQQVLYLHQTPFLTSGTLKDQVIYPGNPNEVHLSDQKLLEILQLLDLTYLLEQQERQYVSARGDVRISFKRRSNREWIELLSPGEQQRLCLARVLFWQPRFVYLDEASSAIDYDIEKVFYQQCREMGCSIVSVGHSETLKRYHDVLLRVSHDGKWAVSDISR